VNVQIALEQLELMDIEIDGVPLAVRRATLRTQVTTVEGTQPSRGRWELELLHDSPPIDGGAHSIKATVDRRPWQGQGTLVFNTRVSLGPERFTRTVLAQA
jgi:hypothetical protein